MAAIAESQGDAAAGGSTDPRSQNAAGAFVLALCLAMIAVGLLLRFGQPEVPATDRPPLIGAVGLVAFGLPGSFLVGRRPSVLGWYAVAIGGVLGFGWLAGEYAWYAGEPDPRGLPAVLSARHIARVTIAPALASLPGLLLLLPDGRQPSKAWRPAGAVAAAALMAVTASAWSAGDQPSEVVPGFDHLGGGNRPIEDAAVVLLVVSIFLGVLSLFHRMLRSSGVERLQLRSIVFGAAATSTILAVSPAASAQARPFIVAAALVPLPAALAVAHARHGLWLVDLVINRAIVFGVVASGVVGLAAAVIAALGPALGQSTGAPLVSLAILALVVQPGYQVVRRAVNRLFYGDAQDPSKAIAAVARDLDSVHDVRSSLRSAAGTVSRALRLPYVAITTVDGVSEAVGSSEQPSTRLALMHGGVLQGWLLVSPRFGESELRSGDVRLLEDLGRQIAVVVHAGTLAVDLRRSRERLVAAREEERRRLRRDLHDEIGPALAAVALQLDALRDVVEPEVDDVLGRCEESLRDCVDDVRRIVDGLGPSQVDELGLVGALTEQAARFRTPTTAVEGSSAIASSLPAAVEVAAYRVASEALANAMRHANPTRVTVELWTDDAALHLYVRDDGGGEPDHATSGVGLRSMRERAEELGGSARVVGTSDGVEVEVVLPIDPGAWRVGGDGG